MKRVFFLLMIPMLLIAQGSGLFIQELNDGRFLLRNSLPPRNVTEEVYELDAQGQEEAFQKMLDGPESINDNGMNGAIITLSFIEGLGWIVSTPFWSTVGAPAAIGTALGYLLYKGFEYINEDKARGEHDLLDPNDVSFDPKELELNKDQPPADGFEWRGNPDTGKGSWVKETEDGEESLYPDFESKSHDPHWDYRNSKYERGYRIYEDGKIEIKKK